MSIKHDAAPRSTQRVRLLKPHRHAGREYRPSGLAHSSPRIGFDVLAPARNHSGS